MNSRSSPANSLPEGAEGIPAHQRVARERGRHRLVTTRDLTVTRRGSWTAGFRARPKTSVSHQAAARDPLARREEEGM